MIDSINNPSNLYLKGDDHKAIENCPELTFPLDIFQHIASYNYCCEGKLRQTCKTLSQMKIYAKIDAKVIAQFIKRFGRALTDDVFSDIINLYKKKLIELIPRIENLRFKFKDLGTHPIKADQLDQHAYTANIVAILRQIPHFKKIDFSLEPYAIQTFRIHDIETEKFQCEIGQFTYRFDNRDLKTGPFLLNDFWEFTGSLGMKDIKIAFPDVYTFPAFTEIQSSIIKIFESPNLTSLTLLFDKDSLEYSKNYSDLITQKFPEQFTVTRDKVTAKGPAFIWENKNLSTCKPKIPQANFYELLKFERIESRKRKGEDLASEVTKKVKTEIL